MNNLKDDQGHNQIFKPSYATDKRLERRADYIISQFTSTQNIEVLEIGCGMGIMANMMAAKTTAKILGVDLCEPFIEAARKEFNNPRLSFEIMDFNKAEDFINRKFNYIIGNGILHHLYYHLDSALVNIRKLLKPGGKMIFLEPNIYNPYVSLIFKNSYFRRKAALEPTEMAFSKRFIVEKLQTAGYKNIKVEYKDFLLPGIPKIFVKPSIVVGGIAEKMPLIKKISQSIFISAEN